MSNDSSSPTGHGPAPGPAPGPNTRRAFLQSLLGACLAITGATFIFPVLSYLSPRKATKGNNVLLGIDGHPVPVADLSRAPFVVGVGVDSEATIVVRYGGELRAFSAVCTHLGCLVKWDPAAAEFICPCHGGKFNADGVNTFGPPPRPLKQFRPSTTPDGFIGLQEVA